ncbi:MAG: selenium metabolism-associated LysR family transcriptional regulator [Acidobacteriota bacterium]
MRLDLALLEVFCTVYDEGSFSKAALKLRLTQPTVSGHVKNLEEAVGTRLLDRLPRNVVPTEAGKILYRRGRSILNEKEAAIRELGKFLNCVEGSLTICASTIPGEYLLPQLIAEFHAKHPGVNVELQISDSKDVCNKVLARTAELGFVGARFDTAGLEFRRFASDTLGLIVPNNDEWKAVESITLDDLAKKPFLSREGGSGTRVTFERAVGRELEGFNIIGRFGSTNAVKEGLKAGLGISILSLLAAGPELNRGELKVVEIEGSGAISREFFMVLNNNLTTSPIADAFIDCVPDWPVTLTRTA